MSVNVVFKPLTFNKQFNQWLTERKDLHPVAASKELPDWFRATAPRFKSEQGFSDSTVKRCVPFLEALSSGFYIRSHTDVNMILDKGQVHVKAPISDFDMPSPIDRHKYEQADRLFNNMDLDVNHAFKYINPWSIKLPKGYSCLFTHPLNAAGNKSITFFSGVVDCDTYTSLSVNFPFILNKGFTEFNIKQGEPLVQVIPFKRENYNYVVSSTTEADVGRKERESLNIFSVAENAYRKLYWHKSKDK